MKYIQSFYNYPVTFSSIDKGIPAKNADGELRNIAEITEKELEILQNKEPLFRSLVERKKYRVLNKLPESYRPAAVLVNEARAEAEAAKAELEALKAQVASQTAEPAENKEEKSEVKPAANSKKKTSKK